MALQHDKINAGYATIRLLREAYLDGILGLEEMEAEVEIVKAELRVLFEYVPPEPP